MPANQQVRLAKAGLSVLEAQLGMGAREPSLNPALQKRSPGDVAIDLMKLSQWVPLDVALDKWGPLFDLHHPDRQAKARQWGQAFLLVMRDLQKMNALTPWQQTVGQGQEAAVKSYLQARASQWVMQVFALVFVSIAVSEPSVPASRQLERSAKAYLLAREAPLVKGAQLQNLLPLEWLK